MNSIPSMTTTNQQPFNSIGEENTAQIGTSLIQNANIRTLINDPIYNPVQIKQPLELINDTIEFTFNNLSFSNLCPKVLFFKTKNN
ncbi:unnamed protein product [Rotaria sp. Silwood2]|nr:unnamed protein product [Rotaria sp. Silwood2]